jgi:hypothetical protein
MLKLLLYGIIGSMISFLIIQLGVTPIPILCFSQAASDLIWVIFGGMVGLLCGLVVNGVIWTIRILSGNWTRLGR